MKTYKSIWVCLLIFLITTCTAVKNSRTDKRTLQQKIESKDFTIYVTRCLPTDLVNSTFGTNEVIKIKNDSAYANLPFHGLLSVNQMDMTLGPICFDGLMQEFTISKDLVKGWNLLFKVNSEKYLYQVNMDISNKGQAVVRVTSTKRTTMTYFGELD